MNIDIKQEIILFLRFGDVFKKGIFALQLSVHDVHFYLSFQKLTIASYEDYKFLENICQNYDQAKIDSIYYKFTPTQKLKSCLAKNVYCEFEWKKFGIIHMLKFINSHKNCEQIHIRLKVFSNWDFGVLSNLVNYCKNVYLQVKGPSPLYINEMYLNDPCRMANLEIFTFDPIPYKVQRYIKKK